jgi:hypothetical protein
METRTIIGVPSQTEVDWDAGDTVTRSKVGLTAVGRLIVTTRMLLGSVGKLRVDTDCAMWALCKHQSSPTSVPCNGARLDVV